MQPHLLVHNKADNVGVVVVEGVTAGMELLGVQLEDNSDFRIVALKDTPIGHKVALADLKNGGDVIKYGEVIGRLVADVPTGDHVHTHNLKTKRW
ncbi:MAG: UxaA family hydrolase [Caulobacteraceae bacterium]